jgi:membrane associated rhomboid family serine protease
MLILPLYDDSPVPRPPVATFALIAGCTAVFLWQQGLPSRAAVEAIYRFGMIPAVIFGQVELPAHLKVLPAPMTLITSMFLHGAWAHLLGNMLFLWLFGRGVESALGAARLLLFYLTCGIAAGLTQAFTNPGEEVPMIGASGAIAGVLGAYLVLHPRGNVTVLVWFFIFIRLIAVPAVILLGLWFLLQLLSAVATDPNEPGVAFWAHVGGFLAGMALVLLFRRRGVRLWHPSRSSAFSVSRTRSGPWGRPRGGPWS